MYLLSDLRKNRFLRISLTSWLLAQVSKTLIYAIKTGKLEMTRLLGDGGMPSGHAATVTSLAAASALEFGTDSFAFALSTVLALVVCHDAMGVRLETGKQAAAINELLKGLPSAGEKVKLKEFVGHTPSQVIAGVLLGAANAIVMERLLTGPGKGTV